MNITVDGLRAGLATLPQELYDEIYLHVVSCDSSRSATGKATLRRMDRGSKFPVQLHISRQIRTDIMPVYCSTSTFYFLSQKSVPFWYKRVIDDDMTGNLRQVRCVAIIRPYPILGPTSGFRLLFRGSHVLNVSLHSSEHQVRIRLSCWNQIVADRLILCFSCSTSSPRVATAQYKRLGCGTLIKHRSVEERRRGTAAGWNLRWSF